MNLLSPWVMNPLTGEITEVAVSHLVAGDLCAAACGAVGTSKGIWTRCRLPCCCWPNIWGQDVQLSWILSAFCILETQAQDLGCCASAGFTAVLSIFNVAK